MILIINDENYATSLATEYWHCFCAEGACIFENNLVLFVAVLKCNQRQKASAYSWMGGSKLPVYYSAMTSLDS